MSNRKIQVRGKGGECKPARPDADHPDHLAIEIDAPPDDAAIPADTGLPKGIGEHGHLRRAGLIFLGQKIAAAIGEMPSMGKKFAFTRRRSTCSASPLARSVAEPGE